MNLQKIWEALSRNGIRPEMDFEDIKRVRIINQFCIIGFTISIIYTIFLLLLSSPYLAFFDLFNAILSATIFLITRKSSFKVAAFILFSLAPIGLLAFNYVYGKQGAEYYFFPIFILAFYFYRFGWRSILNLIYLLILFLAAKYLENNIIPTGMAAILSPYFYYTSFIFAFIFGYLALRLFVNEYEKNKKDVDEKNLLLEKSVIEANKKKDEIKILMKELSHRTKNNLQLVSSLISIQSNKLNDSDAKNALDESKNRIISIALIHKKLYQNENLTTVFFKEYIEDLLNFLIEIFVEKNKKIEISTDIDDFEIKIDNAVSLGLILNELLTNSLKYGLNEEFDNRLYLKIKKSENNTLEIYIKDSGNGIQNEKEQLTESFGFMLIRSLVKQMDGHLSLAEDNKNSVKILVKI